METSAIVMAVFISLFLFGGTYYFLQVALKGKGFK